jgi:hypothetical protein
MPATDRSPEVPGIQGQDTSYSLGPDVVLLPLADGTARLLDMGGSFYTVSAVGAEMLHAMLAHGVTAAVRQIASRYRADIQQVRADLEAFLRDLVLRGLLHTRQHRRRTALPFVVLTPGLQFIHRCLRPGKVRAAALLTLAWLSFRLFGWARTVTVWKASHRPANPHLPETGWEETARAVDDAVRGAAASHLLTMECKERALCCWALARWAGVPATLVVGVQLYPLAGHCWCESGRWTLSDSRDRCDRFQPVIKYV